MWRALSVARGDLVMYLDADTTNFERSLRLPDARPDPDRSGGALRQGDLSPAAFGPGGEVLDDAGRVTELTAKPLLRIFYPELSGFGQPLSGELVADRGAAPRFHSCTGYAVETGDADRRPSGRRASTRWPRSASGTRHNRSKPCASSGRCRMRSRSAVVGRGLEDGRLMSSNGAAPEDRRLVRARRLHCRRDAAREEAIELVERPPIRAAAGDPACRFAASTRTSTGPCSAGAASLLRDAEGNFSTLAIRALEACHRAGVEVVIKSGRRKAQVYEDARLIGQPSYIYEMGCGLVDGTRRCSSPAT